MEQDLPRVPQCLSQVRDSCDNSVPLNGTHVQLRLLNRVPRQRTTVSKKEERRRERERLRVKVGCKD